MKRLVVAAAIVDDPHNPSRVLAAKRSGVRPGDAAWEFPGGKAEPGETPEVALRREILEELGTDVKLHAEVANPDPGPWPLNDNLVMRVFVCTAAIDPVTTGVRPDHDELRWLDADSLDDVDWLPGDRPAAAALRGILMLLG